jgi:hypothetical protein
MENRQYRSTCGIYRTQTLQIHGGGTCSIRTVQTHTWRIQYTDPSPHREHAVQQMVQIHVQELSTQAVRMRTCDLQIIEIETVQLKWDIDHTDGADLHGKHLVLRHYNLLYIRHI